MQLRALGIVAHACAVVACSPQHGGDTPSDAGSDVTNGTDGSSGCTVGIFGDANAAIDFQITTPGDTADKVLNDGDSIGIVLPPQTGRVIFLGVRATNIDGCGVQLTGALRDEATNQVRLDARTVNLVRGSDAWGTSAIQGVSPNSQLASYANVPVCPNQWASTDVFDKPFKIEVTLEDRHGRKLTKSVHITPKCVDDIEYSRCQCICLKDYRLGASCTNDGGSSNEGGSSDASVD